MAVEEVAVYRGVTYPMAAWRIVYDYITARRAPDTAFNRRMRRLGVDLDEAYALYRAQMYTPWEIEFVVPVPPPKYKLVEYTKYFEVRVERRERTPPIRVELRGEFTIPAFLEIDDSRVLKVIEAKLREAFTEWGKYWMGPFSDIAKALKETKHPDWIWERREFGWYAYMQSVFLGNWEQGDITYGLEPIAEVDAFHSVVDVEIAKYVREVLAGTWTRRVAISEDEFPSEESE